jgi:hypothetical protein
VIEGTGAFNIAYGRWPAKTFHSAYHFKTTLNKWLSTAGIIAISCCVLLAVIVSLCIGFKWKAFKARLRSKFGNITTTMKENVDTVQSSTRADLARYGQTIRELKNRVFLPSPTPQVSGETFRQLEARIRVHADRASPSNSSAEEETFITPLLTNVLQLPKPLLFLRT